MEKVVEGGSCLHCAFRELLIYCGLPGALQLKIRFSKMVVVRDRLKTIMTVACILSIENLDLLQ